MSGLFFLLVVCSAVRAEIFPVETRPGGVGNTFDPEVAGTARAEVFPIPAPDGTFYLIHGGTHEGLERLSEDGTTDPSFSWGGESVFAPRGVFPTEDGRVLVWGARQWDSVAQRYVQPFGRFTAAGEVDPSFTIPEFEGAIDRVHVDDVGRIYVVGSLSSVGGESRRGVARLRADGTLDATFVPPEEGGISINASALVDGKLLLGGLFENWGMDGWGHILRLDEGGAIDTTFTLGRGYQRVEGMAVNAHDEIFIWGEFLTFNGIFSPRFALLDVSGQVISEFMKGEGPEKGEGTGVEINAAVAQGDGWLIAGNFEYFHGWPTQGVVRLERTGEPDRRWITQSDEYTQVFQLAVAPTDQVFLQGFGRSGRVMVPGDRNWSPQIVQHPEAWENPVQPGERVELEVRVSGGPALEMQWLHEGEPVNDNTLISGAHTSTLVLRSFQAIHAGSYQLRVTAPGDGGPATVVETNAVTLEIGESEVRVPTLDLDWAADPLPAHLTPEAVHPLADGGTLVEAGGTLRKLDATGRLLPPSAFWHDFGGAWVDDVVELASGMILVNGSSNTSYGGEFPLRGLALLDSEGHRLPVPVEVAGGSINTLCKQGDRGVLVGGDFTRVDGSEIGALFRLRHDGTLDDSFAIFSRYFPEIQEIATDGSGNIYVLVKHGNLYRFGPDGEADPDFQSIVTAPGTGSEVEAMACDAEGRLVLVGRFALASGGRVFRGIVRVLPNGVIDESFGATHTTGVGSLGENLAVLSDGTIFADSRDEYDSFNLRRRVVRLDADGVFDPQFSVHSPTSLKGEMHLRDMVARGDRIEVVGDLGLAREGIIRIKSGGREEEAPSITSRSGVPTLTSGADLNLFVLAEGETPLSYTWTRDGVEQPGAVGAQFFHDASEGPEAGTYRVTVTNRLGSAEQEFVINRTPQQGMFEVEAVMLDADLAVSAEVRLNEGRPDGAQWLWGDFEHTPTGQRQLAILEADGVFDATRNAGLTDWARLVQDAVVDDDGALVALTAESTVSTYLQVFRVEADGASVEPLLTSPAVYNSSSDSPGIVQLLGGDFVVWGRTTSDHVGFLRVSPEGEVRPRPALDNLDINPTVRSVLPLADGGFLAAGEFLLANGMITRVTRIREDGTVDETYRPDLASVPAGLQSTRDGRIFAIGSYTEFATWAGRRFGIVQLDENGRLDPAFRSEIGGDMIESDAAGRLYVMDQDRVVRVFDNGVVDRESMVEGTASHMASTGDGLRLFGDLQSIEGKPAADIVDLSPTSDGILEIVSSPADTSAVEGYPAALSVAARGQGGVTYQWFKDGVEVAGETGTILRFPAVRAEDVGQYVVEVANATGRISTDPVELVVATNSGWAGAVEQDWAGGARFNEQARVFTDALGRHHVSRIAGGRFLVGADGEPTPQGALEVLIADYSVNQVVFEPDGGYTVFGWSISVESNAPARRVVRFDANGQVDGSFREDPALPDVRNGLPMAGGGYLAYGSYHLIKLGPGGAIDPDYPAFSGTVEEVVSATDGTFWVRGELEDEIGRIWNVWKLDSEGRFDVSTSGWIRRPETQYGLIEEGAHRIQATPDGGVVALTGLSRLSAGVREPRLTRLTSDGAVDHALRLGRLSEGATILDIAVDTAGRIYVLWDTEDYDGVSVGPLARLLPDGSLDPSFAAAERWDDYQVSAEVVTPDRLMLTAAGDLFVADSSVYLEMLESFGGSERGAALFKVRTTPDASWIPGVHQVAPRRDVVRYVNEYVRLAAPVVGPADAAYSWFKDGEIIADNNGSNLVIPSAGEEHAGTYSVRVQVGETVVEFEAYRLQIEASGLAVDLQDTAWSGKVNEVLPMPDGRLLIVSAEGLVWEESQITNFLTVNPDGTDLRPLPVRLQQLSGSRYYPPTIHAVAVDRSGRIYVAGTHNMVNRSPHSGLLRLTPTGEWDATWSGVSLDQGQITSLAASNMDDVIAVGGTFTALNGQAASGLALLDGDGAVMPGFAPILTPSTYPRRVIFRADDSLAVLEWRNFPKRFSVRLLARDGTVLGLPLLPTEGNEIQDLLEDDQGRLLVYGRFNAPQENILRLTDTGVDDFDAELIGPFLEVVPESGGAMVVIDDERRLHRLLPDGGEDLVFAASVKRLGGVGGAAFSAWSSSGALHLVAGGDDVVVVVGFERVGHVYRRGIAKLDVARSAGVAGWRHETTTAAGVLLEEIELDGTVVGAGSEVQYSWVRTDEPDVVLGTEGTFTLARAEVADSGTYAVTATWSGGSLSREMVVEVAPPTVVSAPGMIRGDFRLSLAHAEDGIAQQAWPCSDGGWWIRRGETLRKLTADGAYDESVQPLVLQDYRSEVFQAGDLLVILEPSADEVGLYLIVRLGADGGRTQGTATIDGDSVKFAVDARGRIYVAYRHSEYTDMGWDSEYRIDRLTEEGQVDPDFDFDPTGVTGTEFIVALPNGGLFVTGDFTAIAGVESHSLIKLLEDGRRDPAFYPGSGKRVEQAVLLPDGRWLVAGYFDVPNLLETTPMQVLQPDGAIDVSFGWPDELERWFSHAFAVRADGRIVLSGLWNDEPAVMQLMPDGQLDSRFPPVTFQPAPDGGTIWALDVHVLPTGDVMVAGDFAGVNQKYGYADMVLLQGVPYAPEQRIDLLRELSLSEGEALTLVADVMGAPDLVYHWYHDGELLVGDDAEVLHRINASPEDAGVYHFSVENDYGSLVSGSVVVDVLYGPRFTTHPDSVITTEGGEATVGVDVAGNPPPMLQWRREGEALAGETGTSLQLSGVGRAQAGRYDVVATNAVGTATSAAAELIVQFSPEIVVQPVGTTTRLGQATTLDVDVEAVPAATFQWFRGDVALEGETAAQLYIADTQVAAAGDYSVRVSNPLGVVMSAVATVQVYTGPEIVEQPQSVRSLPGDAVNFAVLAEGVDLLTYQWHLNGTPIPGATGTRLELADIGMADVGSYTVVVSDEVGDVTSVPAELTLVQLSGEHKVVGPGYRPGMPVMVDVVIRYVGSPDRITLSTLPPEPFDGAGWTFLSEPDESMATAPAADENLLWEWSWTGLTESREIRFRYAVQAPSTAEGPQSFAGSVVREDGNETSSALLQPDPLVLEQASRFHSADTDGNFRLELSELLRVIELYNTRKGTQRTGAYRVSEDGSMDGFEPDVDADPGSPSPLTRFHSGDFDRDGKVNLSELLRVIELYNHRVGSQRVGGYRSDSESADGFTPGLTEE